MSKFSVSNIAWDNKYFEEYLEILCENNYEGLEFSPNKFWKEPILIEESQIINFKKMVDNFNLEIPSMHSLFYTKKTLNLFSGKKDFFELLDYLVKLANIAEIIDCPIMVLGSGTTRKIGKLNINEANKIYSEFLNLFLEKTNDCHVKIVIEPLSKQETDYINNTDEAFNIIKNIRSERLGLHIDLKSSVAERENLDLVFKKYFPLINHVHISDLKLEPPSPKFPHHKNLSKILKDYNYSKFISIEMKQINDKTYFKEILEFTKNLYSK